MLFDAWWHIYYILDQFAQGLHTGPPGYKLPTKRMRAPYEKMCVKVGNTKANTYLRRMKHKFTKCIDSCASICCVGSDTCWIVYT